MSAVTRSLLCLLFVLMLVRPAGAEGAPPVQDRDVHVERAGDHFTVDMIAHAPVDQERAWAVLTDYEHMADFMPNLRSSDVLERNGMAIKVRQAGRARYGLFSADFDFVREFILTPRQEIRAHSAGGNIKRMDSVMRLEPEAGGVRLQYHAEVQPDFWLPPMIGPVFVRHETAEQFSAMIHEMVRRK